MPRVGLSPAAVVDAALDVVDAEGYAGLTLAAVAARTGVATPSLYKHVGGLAELRELVGVRVLEEMTAEFTRAVLGRSRDDALIALVRAYRQYVVRHPQRYAAMPLDPLHRPASADAGQRMLEVFLAVLAGYGITGAPAVHTLRCLRAAVHGFAALEAGGGFGLAEDVDASFDQLVRLLLAALPRE